MTTATNPSISADGRYVAFNSYASNLVAGDTNGTADVSSRTCRPAPSPESRPTPAGRRETTSYSFRISADGRYVAFYSDASNLVAGDTNGTYDVFVKDLQTGAITRVSADERSAGE